MLQSLEGNLSITFCVTLRMNLFIYPDQRFVGTVSSTIKESFYKVEWFEALPLVLLGLRTT